MPKPKLSPLDRFMQQVYPDPNCGCWLWGGSSMTKGYGQFSVAGKTSYGAHRFSYEAFKGPIPDGLYVLHTCDFRPCVNPDHLWLGTPVDNSRDMVAKNRSQRRAYCKRGHAFTPENIYQRPNHHDRACRTCRRMRKANEI